MQYLYYLINPREDEAQRTSYKQYYIPTVEIKNCNVFIDRQNVIDQPGRHKLITYDSIEKYQQIRNVITQLSVCWTNLI